MLRKEEIKKAILELDIKELLDFIDLLEESLPDDPNDPIWEEYHKYIDEVTDEILESLPEGSYEYDQINRKYYKIIGIGDYRDFSDEEKAACLPYHEAKRRYPDIFLEGDTSQADPLYRLQKKEKLLTV